MIRVLIVDDHAIVRKGIRALLTETGGFEIVAEADNGEDAVVAAIATKPDVILMDLVMPGLGGVVSQATARSHVSNILGKLHLANRTQAALYALREGLTDLEI